MRIPKAFSRRYYKFTEELVPVETVCHEWVGEYGILHSVSYGGTHPFLRKPGSALTAYQKAGHPFGKTIKGLKKFI